MISIEKSKDLVKEIQTAHRISVAFYRRILPTLDAIASAFDCGFREWKPLHTALPCKSGTRPSSVREWNFVPLFASSHFYSRTESTSAYPEDLAIKFNLYVDDNMDPKIRKTEKLPGAIDMEFGKAVIKIELRQPIACSDIPFEKLLEKQNANIRLTELAIPLEEIITDYQSVINKIRPSIIDKR